MGTDKSVSAEQNKPQFVIVEDVVLFAKAVESNTINNIIIEDQVL